MSTGLTCYTKYFEELIMGVPKSLTGVPPLPAPPGCDSTYKFLNVVLKNLFIVGVTLGTFALFSYFYLNNQPTIVMKHTTKENPCPDLWTFDGENCNPTYDTQCNPFNPLNYAGHECDIAKSCGTSWKGLCK